MPKRSFDTMNNFYSSFENCVNNNLSHLSYPPPEPFRARCRSLDQDDSY
jgi:hypothetical protein